jgi:hypothetical protein
LGVARKSECQHQQQRPEQWRGDKAAGATTTCRESMCFTFSLVCDIQVARLSHSAAAVDATLLNEMEIQG